MKMKYPEKYIEYGDFTFVSGLKSTFKFEAENLLTDRFYVKYILKKIPIASHYVGILTGGGLMAGLIWIQRPNSKISYVKQEKREEAFALSLMGEKPSGDYVLIDDIVTTEGSLNRAIEFIGRNPREIWVAVDRRNLEGRTENLEINSVFEI